MTRIESLLGQGDAALERDPAAAEAAYGQALGEGPDGISEVRAWSGIGAARLRQGRGAEAAEALRRAADLCGALPRVPPLLHGRVLALYGRACVATDDFGTGVPVARRAVDLLRGLADGAAAPEGRAAAERELALACLFLSSAEYQRGDLDAAESLTRTALGLWTRLEGPRCADVATCLNNLGRIHEERGDAERGVGYHRRAAEIYLGTLGDHPQTAFSLGNLGTALAAAGEFVEAAGRLEACLAMYAGLGRTEGRDIDGYRRNLEVCRRAAAELG